MAFERKPTRGRRGERRQDAFPGIDKKVISIRRVAKVNAGSKRLRFSAFVTAGDKKGQVGLGLGRGADTRLAIDKATKHAVAHMVRVDLLGDTIPHEAQAKYGAAKVFIKPAGPGTGVIASSSVRAVMEVAGVRNVLSKQLGSGNSIANAYCTVEALKSLNKKRIMEKRSARQRSKIEQNKTIPAKTAKPINEVQKVNETTQS